MPGGSRLQRMQGGQVPDHNIERMRSNTRIPVPEADTRRLELVVSGLNAARGLPLFFDVTVVSPLLRNGERATWRNEQPGRTLLG